MRWGRAASSHQNRTSYTTTALLMQHQQYRNQTELLITLQHAGKLTNKYRHNANTCPLWLHTHWAILIHDTDAICWSSHVNEKKDDDKPTEADSNHGSVLNWRLRSSMEQLWHPNFLTKGRWGVDIYKGWGTIIIILEKHFFPISIHIRYMLAALWHCSAHLRFALIC